MQLVFGVSVTFVRNVLPLRLIFSEISIETRVSFHEKSSLNTSALNELWNGSNTFRKTFQGFSLWNVTGTTYSLCIHFMHIAQKTDYNPSYACMLPISLPEEPFVREIRNFAMRCQWCEICYGSIRIKIKLFSPHSLTETTITSHVRLPQGNFADYNKHFEEWKYLLILKMHCISNWNILLSILPLLPQSQLRPSGNVCC
jgi:hypothetical protein